MELAGGLRASGDWSSNGAATGVMPRREATCAVGARAGSYGSHLPSTGAFQNRYKGGAWRALPAPVPSAQLLTGTGMSAVTASELQQRLSEQLQALSQVGETLTLRLLDLEERLGGLEDQLQELQLGSLSQEDHASTTGDLLAATEERIAHLEDLLSAQASAHTRVQPLPLRRPVVLENSGIASAAQHNESSSTEETELELNPFPEEDEDQPFMDELSA